MVTDKEAISIIKQTFPLGEIEAGPADYKDLKLFVVVTDDLEGELDNIYGVDGSGNVVGIPIMTDLEGILNALRSNTPSS